MIGKLIGAAAGAQVAKHSRNIGGIGGAAIGALAVPIVSRMRVPALLALGAAAYAFKKLTDEGGRAAPKPASRGTSGKVKKTASAAA